ncbi:hypothetical protein BC628DRAFT_1397444 [Trametes gibbosa]|nr:hypothetical protein BC628DRAFT_1397444 [Trametes gibbosa]
MTTLNSQDRFTFYQFNALSSGTGRSSRNAFKQKASDIPDLWKNRKPHPIPIPANGAQSPMKRRSDAASNPYSGGRMHSTLDERPRTNGQLGGPSANRTATRTVLHPSARGERSGNSRLMEPPAKRMKIEPSAQSPYFSNGTAGTGKGKAPAHSAVVVLDEEDVGELVHRAQTRAIRSEEVQDEKESTPDPLDLLPPPKSLAVAPQPRTHAFERMSPALIDPLPPDGPSTTRLRARYRGSSVSEVVDVDATSDIESASGFDREDMQTRKAPTPNGRKAIPDGNVKQKIHMFEQKDLRPALQPPHPIPVRMIDLKQQAQQKSVKSAMRSRNGKAAPSLGQFGIKPVAEPLDPHATAPSGFGKPDEPIPVLPLDALSLGCQIMQNTDVVQPHLWVRIQRTKPRGIYLLHLIDGAPNMHPMATFHLDRDFQSFQYTEPSFAMAKDAVVVLKFQSTPSAKISRKTAHFHAGDKHARGCVTLKFLMSHANLNGSGYSTVLDILKGQIQESFEMRGSASTSCWELVENAALHSTEGIKRTVSRPTRSSAASRKPSPVSAGPSNSTSTPAVMPDREGTSASAPPSRAYGRVTRQSARDARPSETPEVLDELVLVYPPSGTGAVNITRGDLKRLDNGQYLNDTLIEFGLKRWLHTLQMCEPELAEQIHVFNSFFFKKLNSKKDIKDTYPSVRKWTSKVDIFKKKYIIVPINENFHWYLAIIVNPADILHRPPPEALRSVPQTRKRKREYPSSTSPSSAPVETEATPDDDPAENRSDTAQSDTSPDAMAVDRESEGEGREVETMLRFTQSCNIVDPQGEPTVAHKNQDRRSCSGDIVDISGAELQYPSSEEPMDVDIVPSQEKESRPPDPTKDASRNERSSVDDPSSVEDASVATQQPEQASAEDDRPADGELTQKASDANDERSQYPIAYVYTFDSLGSRHAAPANKLAKYLQHEAVDKKGYQIENTCMATYKQAKAPMQKNFCDCGLFVLAFAAAFMKDPDHSVACIQNSQIDWYDGTMENLRETFRNHTIELSEAWRKERAEKEGAKEDVPSDKAKAKAVEVGVIDESDDEIVVGDIIPAPPKGGNKGGKKGNTGKAARLRG